jgi:hypothetical protein
MRQPAHYTLFRGGPDRAGIEQDKVCFLRRFRLFPAAFPGRESESRGFGKIHLAAVGLKKEFHPGGL